MKKSYSLGLIGWRANSLAETNTSGQMLMAGLENEFKLLNHVNLHIIPLKWEMESNINLFFDNLSKLDFLLIRCYTLFPIIQEIQKAKNKIKYQICSFIEHSQKTMDYSFGFLKDRNPNCHIPFPYCKDFMINKPKNTKTILLDNSFIEGDDFSKKISEWIYPLIKENYKIYQLTKKNTIADFIEPIIECNYKEYMEKTSMIETFIQTHAGSYEHSVVDMVGRGIRTLIPIIDERIFVPQEIISDLKLPTFTCQQELLDIIKTPINIDLWNSKINKMTEMKKAVRIIDKHFQEVLMENK